MSRLLAVHCVTEIMMMMMITCCCCCCCYDSPKRPGFDCWWDLQFKFVLGLASISIWSWSGRHEYCASAFDRLIAIVGRLDTVSVRFGFQGRPPGDYAHILITTISGFPLHSYKLQCTAPMCRPAHQQLWGVGLYVSNKHLAWMQHSLSCLLCSPHLLSL